MNTRDFVKKCDLDFRTSLEGVASRVVQSSLGERGIRLLSLAGPTCSGKTTAAKMLSEYIEAHLGRVHIISIDDFFYSREYLNALARSRGEERVDYDSERTIDLEEFSRFVGEVLSGGSVHCPIYDFARGERSGYREISSSREDVFIFEGIQAIYPSVTDLLSEYGYVSMYIAPQTSIFCGEREFLPDHIRFLRRIVRDAYKRSTPAELTMRLWESVRANEEKNIFPYAEGCTYKIDSTHQYELSVLKPFLEGELSKIGRESEYRQTSDKILESLEGIEPISREYIDRNSLYTEFV